MSSKIDKNTKRVKYINSLGRKRKIQKLDNFEDNHKSNQPPGKTSLIGIQKDIEEANNSSACFIKDNNNKRHVEIKKEINAKDFKKKAVDHPEKEKKKGIANPNSNESKCSDSKNLTSNNKRKIYMNSERIKMTNSDKDNISSENDISLNNNSNNIDKEFEQSENSLSSEYSNISFSGNKNKSIKEEKDMIIKGINKSKDKQVEIEYMKKLLENNEFKSLQNYSFPYIKQSVFNHKIYHIDQNQFNSLFFYCPVCNGNLRHYSMPFHIFEFHFSYIDEYLSKREIARFCAKLMDQEYIKIKSAIEFFSELAILFSKNEFVGATIWRCNAKSQINEIQNLRINEKYFNKTESQVKEVLRKKLPVNRNRNKNRKYKPLKFKNFLNNIKMNK